MAILGIDEVGRGPLAGPLVVGAVILPDVVKGSAELVVDSMTESMIEPAKGENWILELKDSKKLSPKKREELSEIIWREATVGLGWVGPAELDLLGMTEALKLATRRAVKEVQRAGKAFSQIVIDGKINFLAGTRLEEFVTTVVKADDLIKEVSAASIVAKVARDEYMKKLGERFPQYGFEKHMGYGTKKHREAIYEFGVCPEHRKSFEPVKSMVGFSHEEEETKNTTKIGAQGEEVAREFLQKQGHEIVARNFKTYFYEIDIVSVKEGKIYFTEVKYRKRTDFGGGLAAINKRKLEQMRFAAECFLKYRAREFGKFDPLLAVADVAGEDFELKDWMIIH